MASVRFFFPALVVSALWTATLGAQTPGAITGQVVDSSTHQPLAGVTVLVEGTQRGTVTASDGTFRLSGVPSGTVSVRARRIGYNSQAKPVAVGMGASSSVSFALVPSASVLEGVVVTGYGTQRRVAVTGSIATIDGSAANVGTVANVDQMIEGRAPGVNVTQNSGEPGSGVQIRVRGGTSISASNDPLYVIDGVPVDNIPEDPAGFGIGGSPSLPRNPLNMLNPSDIASVTILKDAAAAVYGTRAANGVVLIETKRGNAAAPSTEYEVSVGKATLYRALPLLSAADYKSFVSDQVAKGNVAPTVLAGLGSANTDWQEALTRSAPVVNHNLSFSGGSSNTQYRASLNHANQQGIVLSSGFKRYQARLNGTHQTLKGRLRLGVDLTGSHVINDYVPFENTGGFEGGIFINMLQFNPTFPVTVTDPTTGESAFYEVGSGSQSLRNPVAMAEQIQDLGKTTRVLGNISADLDLFSNLTGRVVLGGDRFDSNRNTYLPNASPVGAAFGGLARQDNRNNQSQTLQTTLTFHPHYSTSQDLELLGGYEFNQNTLTEFYAESRGFLTDAEGFNGLSSGSQVQPLFSHREDSRIIGFFSRANYSLKDKYFLTGVLRKDGASVFGIGNKWATFPAISGSWRLSQESFFPRGPFSELRLRAGWGKQGNPGVPPYASLILLAADGGSRYVFGERAVTGFTPTQNPNPNLKWEETAQTNVALDYGFMQNRFTGSVEYYIKNTKDLLLTVPVAQPAVVSTRLENIGKTRNKGLEASLDGQVIKRDNFSWTGGIVFDVQRNTVVDLQGRNFLITGTISGEGQSGAPSQRIIPGQPIGTFYGPEFVGVDSNGHQMFNKYKVTRDSTGRELTRVLDGTTLSPGGDDYVIIGNANPNFSFGINSRVNFHSFDFSFLVNSEQGNDVFNNTALVYATKGNAKRSKNFIATALNDGVGIGEPQIYSSKYIEDGSFIRVQNLTIGYTFDMPKFTGMGRGARAFFSADNLWLITNYTGYDPEVHTDASINGVATRGIDYLHYPRPRTFTGGLRVSF
ncbi:MAG: SusC/RagA family TonB-linked outer membrane protein [Gemmatimonadaceae bacterium]